MSKENENEFKVLFHEIPILIDVTLYKYNYYDNLILGSLKRSVKYIDTPNNKNSFIVPVNDFINLLNIRFSEELDNIRSVSSMKLKENATSIFFLNEIFSNFINLKYVKINVSNERNYTRLIKDDKNKDVLTFDYRVLNSIIDFTKYLNNKNLKLLNDFLTEIGLIKKDLFSPGQSFFKINTSDFIDLIAIADTDSNGDRGKLSDKYAGIVQLIYTLIDPKIEQDNSTLIIITDYPA